MNERRFTNEKIRKAIIVMVILIISMTQTTDTFALSKEDMTIDSKILYMVELNSNTIMYDVDSEKRIYPASITKLITAMLIIENLDLNEQITVTGLNVPSDESTMKLQEGEVLTVEQMLWGILVFSANDACYVLADKIAGSAEGFAVLMNEKAKEIGVTDTNFVTSSGIHADNHYSTAKDLALIMEAAMEYDLIKKIMSTPEYTIPATNKFKAREMKNSNALLSGYKDLHVTIDGKNVPAKVKYPVMGKTGYETTVGYNLLNVAENNGMRILTVTIGADDKFGRFEDTLDLLGYAFDNYETIIFVEKGEKLGRIPVEMGSTLKVPVVTENGLYITKDKKFTEEEITYELKSYKKWKAPIKEGQELGVVESYVDGKLTGTLPFYAARDEKVGGPWTKKGITDGTFILICVMVGLIVIFGILVAIRRRNLKRNREIRRMRRERIESER